MVKVLLIACCVLLLSQSSTAQDSNWFEVNAAQVAATTRLPLILEGVKPDADIGRYVFGLPKSPEELSRVLAGTPVSVVPRSMDNRLAAFVDWKLVRLAGDKADYDVHWFVVDRFDRNIVDSRSLAVSTSRSPSGKVRIERMKPAGTPAFPALGLPMEDDELEACIAAGKCKRWPS
jgi:hypothetical protein